MTRSNYRDSFQKILRALSITFSVIAAVLIIILILSHSARFTAWWQGYQDYLFDLQYEIESIDNKWLFAAITIFLFFFKAFVPLYPLSIVCAATGVVFPIYFSLPLNFIGMALHYTLKYMYGRRMGTPASVKILLKKSRPLNNLVKREGKGNPWLLVVLRMIPFMPVNPVSQLYGSIGFEFKKFLYLSLLGYLPLLSVYTVIGRNAYKPFSASFIMPIIITLMFSAAVAAALNYIFFKRGNKNEQSVIS